MSDNTEKKPIPLTDFLKIIRDRKCAVTFDYNIQTEKTALVVTKRACEFNVWRESELIGIESMIANPDFFIGLVNLLIDKCERRLTERRDVERPMTKESIGKRRDKKTSGKPQTEKREYE